MSLSPESLQLIAADPRWRTQRIARVDTPDGPLLIKGRVLHVGLCASKS